MKIEYPEKTRDRHQIYDTPESWLDERMKLDDKIDYYKEKLERDKRKLEITKGLIARLNLKKTIRETEDIIQHLEESAKHWFRDIEYKPQ